MTDATNADPIDLDALEATVREMADAYPYVVIGQREILAVTLPAVLQELRALREVRAYARHLPGCSGRFGDAWKDACRCGWNDLEQELTGVGGD